MAPVTHHEAFENGPRAEWIKPMNEITNVRPAQVTEPVSEGQPFLLTASIRQRARSICDAGGLEMALANGSLPKRIETTLSEAVVLGLLKQGVSTYFAIFGHGSTDLGEVLRIYTEEGVTRTINCRNEVAMAHAATALRWAYGETAAVVTSIGPGAMQAMAGSLAAASNGVGVYHIYGDETTYGEGYNMQQIPKPDQGLYGRITADFGRSYVLHTPQATREAMRQGSLRVFHPFKAAPFFLMLPINVQPARFELNIAALPDRPRNVAQAPAGRDVIEDAAAEIRRASRVVIKAGGGTRGHDEAIRRLAAAAGATVILSPGSTGVLPDADPRNMHVAGSKGSISGNYAMANADLIIVAGSRAVCQADCSGTGYKSASHIVNINADMADALHYNRTTALIGDIGVIASALSDVLERDKAHLAAKSAWLASCAAKKEEWRLFKAERYAAPALFDEAQQRSGLPQPAAIKIVADFAKSIKALKFFDAGDVQANGFQIVEDDNTGETLTETGASYMGFASSALLANAGTRSPRYAIAFSGDGSFMMNPQILIDAVAHNVRAMLVIFDNRRMAAITGLQHAQYNREFRTNDDVVVDYVQLAAAVTGVKAVYGGTDKNALEAALKDAYAHDGLSVVHVPVYAGEDPLAGLGAWGNWNVGNWCEDVQDAYIQQEI
jgi:3D-(3,5/4)-trihydroxycyclohexane-1,2-dione acylhydrolase (decyclizing)